MEHRWNTELGVRLDWSFASWQGDYERAVSRLKARAVWAPAAKKRSHKNVTGSAAVCRMLRSMVAPVIPERLATNWRMARQLLRSHQKQSPLSLMTSIFA